MQLHEWHRPVESPRGAVALVHGAGEHCGRYEHVAGHLNRSGYAMLGQDLPGHGRSPGHRGHISRFDDYLPVVDSLLGRLNELYPDVPQFLYGHSMGGLIAVRWLQTQAHERGLQGIVLTSPSLELALPVSPALVRVAGLLDRLAPTLRVAPEIPARTVSRHPDVVASYGSDQLVIRRATVRWGMEFQRGMEAARTGPAEFRAPTLILQAGADQLVSAKATREFAKRLRAPRKEYREFDGYYHELHNEPERDEILAIITSFLDSTLDAPPG